MNKNTLSKHDLILWLVSHLDNWPKKVQNGPILDGWSWFKKANDCEVSLGLDLKYAKPQTITKTEWRTESMKKITATPAKIAVEAMIDIETFDVTDEAVVFQAAIIFFDKNHTPIYRETWNLNFDEQYAAGRDVSASTLVLHLGIPSNAMAALKDKEVVTMTEFSAQLNENFKIYKPKQVWAKGSFDFNILENLFNYVARKAPWKFYQLRELRTLMSECGVKKGDVSHNALEDCEAQLKQLAACRSLIAHAKLIKVSFDEPAADVSPIPSDLEILKKVWSASSDYLMAQSYPNFAEDLGGVQKLERALRDLIDVYEAGDDEPAADETYAMDPPIPPEATHKADDGLYYRCIASDAGNIWDVYSHGDWCPSKNSDNENRHLIELNPFREPAVLQASMPEQICEEMAAVFKEIPPLSMKMCTYTVDQGVTDALEANRVAYRGECGYQLTIEDGHIKKPLGPCELCKGTIAVAAPAPAGAR